MTEVSQSLVGRYQQVITVLLKYGFEDVVSHPPLNRFLPQQGGLVPRREGKPVSKYTRFERIRMVCEELGTTFIKFAQIASNRPDLLPEELIAELSKFQDDVDPIGSEKVRSVIETEVGRPLSEILDFFDDRPLASASIAQVHRAKLMGGREVVFKVQRPGIRETVEMDIHILRKMATLVEDYFPTYKVFQPVELVSIFERSIRKELRFTNEAASLQRFQEDFKGNGDIYIPRLYEEFTSDKVLCLEYIEGIKINNLQALKAKGFTGEEIAKRGIDLYFQQVFEHGFFHADPHPGNIRVLDDGRICFLDFGMMGNIVESDKELLADLLLAVYDKDLRGLKYTLEKFSVEGRIENDKALEYDIMDFFDEYTNKAIGQIDENEVLKGLNAMFYQYNIRVPSNLLLLMKALVIIEGVGLQINPQYDIIANVEPFVRKLLAQKYAPHKLSRRFLKAMGDMTNLAINLPEDVEEVIHKVREGKLHIEFEHQGLDEFYNKLEIVSNRISFTLVLSSLILASSLMVLAHIPPFVYNISLPGFIGFVLSGFFALRLMISIIRHGNF